MGVVVSLEQKKARGPWDDEAHDLAVKMWVEGNSAGDIAAELCRRNYDVTRNAVIGRLTRAGYNRHNGGSNSQDTLRKSAALRAERARQRQKAGAAKRSSAPPRPGESAQQRALRQIGIGDIDPVPLMNDPEIPDHQRKTIDDLESTCCRWPYGDKETGFHFCHGKKVQGLPYCADHSRRAFQPPQPRQHRAPAANQQPAIPTFAESEKETA